MGGVENKDADEDEDESEDRHEDKPKEGSDDSIYILNSSAIKVSFLHPLYQLHKLNTTQEKHPENNGSKAVQGYQQFFQGQFLQGWDFLSAWVEYHPSAIAQAENGEVTHMHCKEAWRASMAFSQNQNLVCETSECCYFAMFIWIKAFSAYVDPACPGITQLLLENHYFKHVVDKQVRAGKGLHNFVTKHVTLALKPGTWRIFETIGAALVTGQVWKPR